MLYVEEAQPFKMLTSIDNEAYLFSDIHVDEQKRYISLEKSFYLKAMKVEVNTDDMTW